MQVEFDLSSKQLDYVCLEFGYTSRLVDHIDEIVTEYNVNFHDLTSFENVLNINEQVMECPVDTFDPTDQEITLETTKLEVVVIDDIFYDESFKEDSHDRSWMSCVVFKFNNNETMNLLQAMNIIQHIDDFFENHAYYWCSWFSCSTVNNIKLITLPSQKTVMILTLDCESG